MYRPKTGLWDNNGACYGCNTGITSLNIVEKHSADRFETTNKKKEKDTMSIRKRDGHFQMCLLMPKFTKC